MSESLPSWGLYSSGEDRNEQEKRYSMIVNAAEGTHKAERGETMSRVMLMCGGFALKRRGQGKAPLESWYLGKHLKELKGVAT